MSPLVFLLLLFAVFGLYGVIGDRVGRPPPRRRDREDEDEERLDTLVDIAVARPRRGARR